MQELELRQMIYILEKWANEQSMDSDEIAYMTEVMEDILNELKSGNHELIKEEK